MPGVSGYNRQPSRDPVLMHCRLAIRNDRIKRRSWTRTCCSVDDWNGQVFAPTSFQLVTSPVKSFEVAPVWFSASTSLFTICKTSRCNLCLPEPKNRFLLFPLQRRQVPMSAAPDWTWDRPVPDLHLEHWLFSDISRADSSAAASTRSWRAVEPRLS